MIDRNAPIGVFDSGVGGLTVMKEIMHQIPSEKVVYFGDTARVPYGNKSKETVTKFSRQIVHFLLLDHERDDPRRSSRRRRRANRPRSPVPQRC